MTDVQSGESRMESGEPSGFALNAQTEKESVFGCGTLYARAEHGQSTACNMCPARGKVLKLQQINVHVHAHGTREHSRALARRGCIGRMVSVCEGVEQGCRAELEAELALKIPASSFSLSLQLSSVIA